jgi:hypothetical protein
MDTRKLALPLLAFAGGAILGRLFGLQTLARGAMAAAAVTGMRRTRPRRLRAAAAIGRRLTRRRTGLS